MPDDFFFDREQGDILMESARIMTLDVSPEKKSPDVNRPRTREREQKTSESERAIVNCQFRSQFGQAYQSAAG